MIDGHPITSITYIMQVEYIPKKDHQTKFLTAFQIDFFEVTNLFNSSAKQARQLHKIPTNHISTKYQIIS